MELRFRGDFEDCVKRSATDGRVRRLGDIFELRLGVFIDVRFFLFRLRLFCSWFWSLFLRVFEGRGLCLLEGDCLESGVFVEMVKTIFFLVSFFGSERSDSYGRFILSVSGGGFWAALSRGLA